MFLPSNKTQWQTKLFAMLRVDNAPEQSVLPLLQAFLPQSSTIQAFYTGSVSKDEPPLRAFQKESKSEGVTNPWSSLVKGERVLRSVHGHQALCWRNVCERTIYNFKFPIEADNHGVYHSKKVSTTIKAIYVPHNLLLAYPTRLVPDVYTNIYSSKANCAMQLFDTSCILEVHAHYNRGRCSHNVLLSLPREIYCTRPANVCSSSCVRRLFVCRCKTWMPANLVSSDNVFEFIMHVNSKVDLCITIHHGRSS